MKALLSLARQAIENHLLKKKPPPTPSLPDQFRTSRGVFVTLWDKEKNLRGCIGHIEPQHPELYQEIIECAVSAATHDPRFPPMTDPGELKETSLEISLLDLPKEATIEDLDPDQFGVIVEKEGRRGLLLPQIEGIHSTDHQLQIVCEKAGIDPKSTYKIKKFTVQKISEP